MACEVQLFTSDTECRAAVDVSHCELQIKPLTSAAVDVFPL